MNTYPPNTGPLQPRGIIIKPIVSKLIIIAMAVSVLLAIIYAFPIKEESDINDFKFVDTQIVVNENETITLFFNEPGIYNIEINYKTSGLGINFNISNTTSPVYMDISSLNTEKNDIIAIKITLFPDGIWEEKVVKV
jgi:hypothetical protein